MREPDSQRTILETFKSGMTRYGDKTAIVFLRDGNVETRISYRELNQQACRLANYLSGRNIKKGDRVILFLDKSLFFIVAYLAVMKIGGIVVPLNSEFTRSEMAYYIRDTEPALIIAGPQQMRFLPEISGAAGCLQIDCRMPFHEIDFFQSYPDEEPAVQIDADDPTLIIYTSGTTGQPKGAMFNHRNLLHDAMNVIRAWEISHGDVLCHALPLFHMHGLCFALQTHLLVGGSVVMLDRFDPDIVIKTVSAGVDEMRTTVFMAVPAMYNKLIATIGGKKIDFRHMRLWTSGSAPLSVKDFQRLKQVFGKEVVEREGMSETGMNFTNPVHGRRIAGSIGKPLPDLDVRIVDVQSFGDVPTGETGEIWLKSPSITAGYWRKPVETAATFHDGWFKTGDLGYVDADGYYYLTDRIKNIIISGGENISPKEIETVIDRISGVARSAVVGIKDEKWGEKVVAAVEVTPGAVIEKSDIVDTCKRELHKWKCPREIVFVPELPRNTMGKILTDQVRALFTS